MTKTALAQLLALHALGAFLASLPAAAGVTLDGTLGPRASLSGNMTVPASMGTQRGANLFHSFGAFNIGSRESLYFTPTGSSGAISNVISRVTGGNRSTINGVLGSTISGANVFLINPSGIVFGPNAQLDISGSFYASTANYLKLADGGRFDATNPANTSLTVAAPVAFGFLGAAPAITVNGSQLAVPVGKTLGLIGGDITVKDGGLLEAPSGTVHLVSAASRGEATFTPGAFDVSSFAKLGAISVRGGSTVDVSEPTGQNGGGGAVYIRGGKFTLDDSLILATTNAGDSGGLNLSILGDMAATNGALLDTRSSGAGHSGNISLDVGGTLTMSNSSITSSALDRGNGGNIAVSTLRLKMSDSVISSSTLASGNAGSTSITADTINLTDGSQIASGNSSSTATGHGGVINVTAESIAMSGTDTAGFRSALFASTTGSGNAGKIIATTGLLAMGAGSAIVAQSGTASSGRGGDITIGARRAIALNSDAYISTETFGNGDAGNITIGTRDLVLSNGTYIDSSGAGGAALGRGGSIAISATGSISMDNATITSTAFGEGNAGHIKITAGKGISMRNEASIESGAWKNGNGGDIQIYTRDLSLESGAYIENSGAEVPGLGRGGSIAIAATGTISLDNASVSSAAFGEGDAGIIRISTRDLRLANRAYIDSGSATAPASGRGGAIVIDAHGTVSLDVRSSIGSAAFGPGGTGSVQINAANLSLAHGSYISTETQSSAHGGEIRITTTGSLSLNHANISAGAWENGNAGNIRVTTRDLILANGAYIDTSGAETPAPGGGGKIRIAATGTVSLDGKSTIRSIAYGPGGTGSIRVRTGDLSLGNDSYISTETTSSAAGGDVSITATRSIALDDASQILASTYGSGDAGGLRIVTGNLRVASGSLLSSSSLFDATGRGGNVAVFARESVSMLNGAEIRAISTGAGNAGSITVNAGNRLLLDGSSIATSTANSDGGDINVVARDLIYLRGSSITSSVKGGVGNGGNIFIDPTFLVLNHSNIIANAFGGSGGDITINAGNLFQSPTSVVSASSQLGISGSVVISSPITDLSGGLVALPTSYLDASALLGNQCAARVAGNASSLAVAGRGGIAAEPDGWLSGAGSIGPSTTTAAAVSAPEHRFLFPLLASSRAFSCAR